MTKLSRHLRVRHYEWRDKQGDVEPTIRIDCGSGFLILPYDKARQVVDAVHDLCDDHEREQREQARHQ